AGAPCSGLTLPGTAGSYTLSFGGTGLTPVLPGALPLCAGAAASIAGNGGGTSAPAGTAVTPPPAVIVKDASGNPVSGVAVTFAASTGGSVTGPNQTTGTDGIATVGSWTLAPTAGANTLTATAAGSGISGNPVTFTATGTVGAPATLAKQPGGDTQSAPAGTAVAVNPAVRITDAAGNPVTGVAVTFTASSGGSVTGADQTTGTDGIATVGSWTLSTRAGANTLTAAAAGSGISGNPATFTATGTAGTATRLVLTTPPSSSAQSGAPLAPQA